MWLTLPLPPLEPNGCCGLGSGAIGGASRRRQIAEAAYKATRGGDASATEPPVTLGDTHAGERQTGIDLSDCLHEFFEEESLGKGNHFMCPQCTDFRVASKHISIYKLPPILVVHLKRYSSRRHGGGHSKREEPVAFPLANANLAQFVSSPQKVPPNYSLYGLVRHAGELHYGHYTSMVKRHGLWHEANDHKVRVVDEKSLLSNESRKTAYLLFYARDPPSTTSSVVPFSASETAQHVSAIFRAPRQSLSDPTNWPFELLKIPAKFKSPEFLNSKGRVRVAPEGSRSKAAAAAEATKRATNAKSPKWSVAIGALSANHDQAGTGRESTDRAANGGPQLSTSRSGHHSANDVVLLMKRTASQLLPLEGEVELTGLRGGVEPDKGRLHAAPPNSPEWSGAVLRLSLASQMLGDDSSSPHSSSSSTSD
mmetsp:Transcript_26893/g.66318  ORF Transcript_26893/g.66318 Transcript_26893/m.66318 type:complete len:425 (+) Transcript_26893:617-1891(+)